MEELERSIVCMLDANAREKRRFFFDKDKMEKYQIYDFLDQKHKNIGMLVNIRTGGKHN